MFYAFTTLEVGRKERMHEKKSNGIKERCKEGEEKKKKKEKDKNEIKNKTVLNVKSNQ